MIIRVIARWPNIANFRRNVLKSKKSLKFSIAIKNNPEMPRQSKPLLRLIRLFPWAFPKYSKNVVLHVNKEEKLPVQIRHDVFLC